MNGASRYVTLRDYLRVARERRVLVIALALLFCGAALFYSLRQTPTYQAEAALEFQSQNTQSSLVGQNIDNGGQTPDQRAAEAASTLIRLPVLQQAEKILKVKGPATGLGGLVSAAPEAATNLVIVTASTENAVGSALVANAVAQAAVRVAHDDARATYLQAADAQLRVLRSLPKGPGAAFVRSTTQQSVVRLQQLARVASPAVIRRLATVPGSPSSPHTLRTTLLGLLVGLTLGLVAAFARDSLDSRLKSSQEIADETHLTTLGHIPEAALGRGVAPRKRSKVFSEEDLESFRILRSNVEVLKSEHRPKRVLVTSALAEEGKSTVSLGLALAYASTGKRTLLIEGDLRRPTLAARLGVKASPGLTDYLLGRATPTEVLRPISLSAPGANGSEPETIDAAPLVAILAGATSTNAGDLLRSQRSHAFFEQVASVYDVIVIDSSPLLAVSDTLELVQLADAVVLCVRASRTTGDQARAARAALSHFPDRPAGVVVTGVRPDDPAYGYGPYSYGVTAAT